MSGKKPASEKPKNAADIFERSMNWESARVQQIEKSERRAWFVAIVAVFVAAIMGAGMSLLGNLKETVPYVIRVDSATGVPDIVTALNADGVSYDEVMDKYWLAQYVKARETYEWYTIQKDYNTVSLLSSQIVGAEYAAQFTGDNALDKKYGSHISAIASVLSVVPNGRGTGTVRFSKTTKRRDDAGAGTVTRWVATIGYEYRNPSVMKASDRMVNPFGFQVLSYRVDPEMGVATP